jgi:transcriptional regulator with XRE-family HTH domain
MTDRDDARDPRSVRGGVRGEIREFLSTRRARVTPQQAGLPVYGGDRRRVTGLRREEVALLAGISSEYYTRLERGNATGVSESVIEGIAEALQLDDAERAHLVQLIHAAGTTRPPRRRPAAQQVRTTVQRVLDSMVASPAFVLNGRLDVLAANALGRALFSPMYAGSISPPNTARFVFLDPHATAFFRAWDNVANDTVAVLRAEAGRDPYGIDIRADDVPDGITSLARRKPSATFATRSSTRARKSFWEPGQTFPAFFAVIATRLVRSRCGSLIAWFLRCISCFGCDGAW